MNGVELAVDARCRLGEGPTWDASAQRLLWVDIESAVIHELDSDGRHRIVPLTSASSVVVPDADGGLVGTRANAVVALGSGAGEPLEIAALPPDGDGRTNDGRCDPQGRLWIGTVDRSGADAAGVFCVGADGSVVQVRAGVGMSNGIDWSPDGRRCYHVDSLPHRVDELLLGDDGLPVSRRTFLQTEFVPDGLTVDADGGVWVAAWDGGAVHRYTPDGRLDRTIEIPGGFITSCAFGGRDGRTLFVTSARDGVSADQLAAQPFAGGLFAVDVDTTGRGYTPFGASRRASTSNSRNEADR